MDGRKSSQASCVGVNVKTRKKVANKTILLSRFRDLAGRMRCSQTRDEEKEQRDENLVCICIDQSEKRGRREDGAVASRTQRQGIHFPFPLFVSRTLTDSCSRNGPTVQIHRNTYTHTDSHPRARGQGRD